jgi:hypothetical protein
MLNKMIDRTFKRAKRRMRTTQKIVWLFMLIGLPLLAQTPERIKLKGELEDLSTALERLQRRQQALSLQADSLAKDIQRRKQQAPSLLQERGLDAALRFSQTLADSLQMLQGREQRLDFSLRQKAEALLKILNEDIARLVKQGEALKQGKNFSLREQIGRELQQCREWQRRCQAWLEQPPPSIIIYQVEAQPDDTPETLRRKSDFLRDQSDRLRREVKRLDAKISDIRGETQVRRRVADFAAKAWQVRRAAMRARAFWALNAVRKILRSFPTPLLRSCRFIKIGRRSSASCRSTNWSGGENNWSGKKSSAKPKPTA